MTVSKEQAMEELVEAADEVYQHRYGSGAPVTAIYERLWYAIRKVRAVSSGSGKAAQTEPVGQIIESTTQARQPVWFNGLPSAGTLLYVAPVAAAPTSPTLEKIIERLQRIQFLQVAEIMDDVDEALDLARSLSHSAATTSLKGSQGKSSERG